MKSINPIDGINGTHTNSEAGQASIYLILVLAGFLMTAMAFSVDLTNMWFHRQQAQAAADAACGAGVMDMLALANGKTPPRMNFSAAPGDPGGNCDLSVAAPLAPTICQYAAFNGFNGSGGLQAKVVSASVSWTFPSTVPGVTTPPALTVAPYLKVVVAENVQTWFMNLVSIPVMTTKASCTCGLSGVAQQPTPLVVLDPTSSKSLSIDGGASLIIAGGPQRALQVNSTATDAVYLGKQGPYNIDTSKGGPNATGSDVGVSGNQPDPDASLPGSYFFRGTSGKWLKNSAAAADPYALTSPPDKVAIPALSPTDTGGTKLPRVVHSPEDGCPDTAPANWFNNPDPLSGYHNGCLEFEPGRYSADINIPNATVAIFKPGVYYLTGNFNITSGEVRPAKPCVPKCSVYSAVTWHRTDGLMFYFPQGGKQGTMNVGNGSGYMGSPQVTPYAATDLTCDGSSPAGVPGSSLPGNVLVAQCTQNGTYYDSQADTTDGPGNPGGRGLLFFQASGNTSTPSFSGGASLAFSGSMYFHSANARYPTVFSLHDAGSNNTFILGQIVADQIKMTGAAVLRMTLNAVAASGSGSIKVGFF